MQTIYIDVLIVLNIYVNYILLRITAKLTHAQLRAGRCIGASVYGSLYSLLILAPELPAWIVTGIKLLAAVTVVGAAFGIHSRRYLLMNTAAFFSANFILAGGVFAAYTWLGAGYVYIGNTCFYIDLSLAVLIVSTAVMYGAVAIVKRFTDRIPAGDYRVIVRYRDKVTELTGIADTGNVLTDYFTGAPVVICDSRSMERMTGHVIAGTEGLPRGFRLLPCSTVSSSGVIPIFRPDEVLIVDRTSGTRRTADVAVGFGETGGMAIFNPDKIKL